MLFWNSCVDKCSVMQTWKSSVILCGGIIKQLDFFEEFERIQHKFKMLYLYGGSWYNLHGIRSLERVSNTPQNG